MSVLLLNATFEPLRVISVKRAVCLLIDDKAEVLEESEEPMRSASTEMPTPKVIRLRYFVKIPYRAKAPLNRRTLMARDGGVCQYNNCTRSGKTIDHVVPRSRGGKHEWDNVVACCEKCNSDKADSLVSELGWKLRTTPFTPSGTKWVVLGIAASTRDADAWGAYLEYA